MARVLVVDDDPVIVRLLEVNLGLEGHDVLTAADGREGLDAIREHRPDLVLLDLMMPELDGWQVCAEVRADPEVADTPIVILSARAGAGDGGADPVVQGYITKPFDPIALLDVVADLTAS
jgi:CheY-like chemotaxis protein